ncbi:DUF4097 family beta strand repeat-containing protein [Paenibacillus koleovorans]|uniref:DUF4097 family beta strand repeat-containing protein n=1 Tax=Paenibacillus koleovorans TaxID=121608 RepID=UPI000FD77309|nr:DUF4097 family beta strand repeat-containing protein [Paenibacillus koleovorans]
MFRWRKLMLLASVMVLLTGFILDFTLTKASMFEQFGEQFVNAQKTDSFSEAKRGVKATAQRQIEIARADLKEVSLASSRDPITVKRAAGSAIQLQYTVTSYSSNAESANRQLDAVVVEEQVSDGRLTLAARSGGKPIDPDDIAMEYVLLVPDGIKLRVEAKGGPLRIQGVRADVEAISEHDMMDLIDITGTLTVKTSFGSVYMAGVSGSVSLDNRSSDATMEDIKGPLTLTGSAGHNQVSRVSGKLSVNAKNGSLRVQDCTGAVEVTGAGVDMQLEQIKNTMQIHSQSGDVRLMLAESEGYRVAAAVRGGFIQANLNGVPVVREDDWSRFNGDIGKGTWSTMIDATGASVTIHTK